MSGAGNVCWGVFPGVPGGTFLILGVSKGSDQFLDQRAKARQEPEEGGKPNFKIVSGRTQVCSQCIS